MEKGFLQIERELLVLVGESKRENKGDWKCQDQTGPAPNTMMRRPQREMAVWCF